VKPDRKTRYASECFRRPGELQFATDVHWLNSVGFPIEGEKDIARALTLLRQQAVSAFSSSIKSALAQFSDANSGQFPTDLAQLLPYCGSGVGDLLLKFYEIDQATEAQGAHADGEWMIRRKTWPNPDSNARLAVFAGRAAWYDATP
jgi:hypothetical protein